MVESVWSRSEDSSRVESSSSPEAVWFLPCKLPCPCKLPVKCFRTSSASWLPVTPDNVTVFMASLSSTPDSTSATVDKAVPKRDLRERERSMRLAARRLSLERRRARLCTSLRVSLRALCMAMSALDIMWLATSVSWNLVSSDRSSPSSMPDAALEEAPISFEPTKGLFTAILSSGYSIEKFSWASRYALVSSLRLSSSSTGRHRSMSTCPAEAPPTMSSSRGLKNCTRASIFSVWGPGSSELGAQMSRSLM
mmetsp:Transcript_11407/g.21638  ORF Transcript_11407/g.21638 Transcript_11407/m.21638 type:complete len:252 (-) Transcript_11407:13-768(-)